MRCSELPWSARAAMSGTILVGTSQGAAGVVLAAQAAIAELLLLALVFWRAAADSKNRAVQDRLRFLLIVPFHLTISAGTPANLAHFDLTYLCRDTGKLSSRHRSRCSAAAARSAACPAAAGCPPGAYSPRWAGHASTAVPVPHADGSATHDQCHPELSTHSSWGRRW